METTENNKTQLQEKEELFQKLTKEEENTRREMEETKEILEECKEKVEAKDENTPEI